MKQHDVLASITDAGAALALLAIALLAHISLLIPVAAAWAVVGLGEFKLARRGHHTTQR